MDSDSEMDAIEGNLLSRFRSMGTTDKDVLISQFQSLLGFQLNPAGCAFFLDMTNWNLQSAVGAYYDFEGAPESRLPSMTFVSDITVGEGQAVPPNTPFVKTWRLQNSGKEDWPSGCTLRFLNGHKMGGDDSVSVPSIRSGQFADISINLRSPVETGTYQGQWRIYTSSSTPFGDIIWVIISVHQDGLLDITQQISRVNCSKEQDTSGPRAFSTFPSTDNQNSPDCEEEMALDDAQTGNTFNQQRQNSRFLCQRFPLNSETRPFESPY